MKLTIVCNSTNPDFAQYFKCKVNTVLQNKILIKETLFFKNKNISLKAVNSINSSFSKKSFFDKFMIIDFLLSFYLILILLKNGVQFIHFTTAHLSNLFLAIWCKIFKIKMVFSIHDLNPHAGKKSFFISLYNNFVIRLLAYKVIVFTSKIYCYSNYSYKFIRIPLCGFKLQIKQPKVGNHILFFGRIEKYKGLSNLLNIISLLRKAGNTIPFIIAGEGYFPDKEKFLSFENVTILNRFVKDFEIFDLFKKAKFTVLPYDTATQSGVIVLSYSFATPVISYDVGSLAEYIEQDKTGFLVRYKNDDEIIRIVTNTNNEEVFKLSMNTIKYFISNYSENSLNKNYSKFYISILKNS